MIDFDNIDEWSPSLTEVLRELLPDDLEDRLSELAPEYIEDAVGILFDIADKDAIIDATLSWVQSSQIVAYHGTRLTDHEVQSVRQCGLVPLVAEARHERLQRALSAHPRWSEVADKLEAAIRTHGAGEFAGCREGQVHLTLSRAGLVGGFNHYLTHGSEFDQHVAVALLGGDGKELLRRDGRPRLIRAAVPGEEAIAATHPFGTPDDMRARGDMPNMIREILESWSYRQSKPEFQSRSLKKDCGLFFCSSVPADWIIDIELLPELADL